MIDCRRFEKLFLLGGLALSGGCATIVSGTSQTVSFNSNPDSAQVSVAGRVIGLTPISVPLKRIPNQELVFSKDGYKTLAIPMTTRINKWFWGNVVIGGLLGSTTDGVSGAVDEYAPDQYMVTLVPEGTTALDAQPSLSDEQKIKEFVVNSYQDLRVDLQQAHGPYLSSLLTMLHVPLAQNLIVVIRIRTLADTYPEIPDFANHVADIGKEFAPK